MNYGKSDCFHIRVKAVSFTQTPPWISFLKSFLQNKKALIPDTLYPRTSAFYQKIIDLFATCGATLIVMKFHDLFRKC
jgi:hypothetical protein